MRKLMLFGLTVVLVVSVAVMSVNAAPTAPPREPSRAELDARRVTERLNRAVYSVRAIQPPDCNPSNAETYIKCLDRYLTRLARGINKALTTFDTFFKCTNYAFVTQYGLPADPTAPEGYEYRAPDPTTGTPTVFLTTALDFAQEGDPFLNFYVVRPTEECINFAR
jgi:hypothetical protein